MDLLSNVLSGLQQESIVFCHAELTAPWGFAKAHLQGTPFHAVTAGCAWVKLSDEAQPRQLEAGDLIVLPQGDAHLLLSEPQAKTISFTELLADRGAKLWQPGMRSAGPVHLTYGGGGALTTLVSGVFAFADRRRNPLVAALPGVIHIRGKEVPMPWLETTLRYLAEEAASGQPGAAAVTAKLADILLIQAIRAHLSLHSGDTSGWLRGMTDPRIGRSIVLMHAEPATPWTVALLAKRIGISRSSFAARFQAFVGQGPIEYLTHWRMHEAAGLLTSGTQPLADVAESVGYQSEVAFSKAFKRWAGQSPTSYRASHNR
jgi:AraC-like DNA-binding protein